MENYSPPMGYEHHVRLRYFRERWQSQAGFVLCLTLGFIKSPKL